MQTRTLVSAQLRASVAAAMQYRADFLVDGLVEVLWMSSAIVPLWVVFSMHATLAGWTASEALLVTAFFTILQGVMEGCIAPSMLSVVEQVRKGTFDFVLLKPVDDQLYVSTAKIQLWKCVNVITGVVLIIISVAKSGRVPSLGAALHTCVMLGAATGILYAIWLMGVSLAFRFGRMDNLTYLFVSIFDAARWPGSVFRGAMRVVFTYVIPLTVMTTFPARALLGNLPVSETAVGVAISAGFLVLSRIVWKRSLRNYTSASS